MGVLDAFGEQRSSTVGAYQTTDLSEVSLWTSAGRSPASRVNGKQSRFTSAAAAAADAHAYQQLLHRRLQFTIPISATIASMLCDY